jgi:hypothetical protein
MALNLAIPRFPRRLCEASIGFEFDRYTIKSRIAMAVKMPTIAMVITNSAVVNLAFISPILISSSNIRTIFFETANFFLKK